MHAHPTHADIAYLPDDRVDKLDAWLPDAAAFPGRRPAVLLIHGGGWYVGDKADARERNISATFSAHGYAVFSINYPLSKTQRNADGSLCFVDIPWPQPQLDCSSALEWMRGEGAARFPIDRTRIAVMGCSAGGTMALLLACKHPHDLAAVIDLYAPTDVRKRAVACFEHAFIGDTPEATLARTMAASPLLHVHADLPPVFVSHGTADTIVPVADSQALIAKLAGLGVPHTYVEVPGAGHSYHLEPEQADLRPSVLEFLGEHLGS